MKTRLWMVGALLTATLFGGAATAQEAPPTKILFLGKEPDHPYGSHMYMHTSGVLAECARLTPGIETVVSNGWPQDPTTLEGVKTIVVYTNPAAELLLDGPHRDQVQAMVRNGVGLVTIHWASTVKKENLERLGPTWLEILGGTWVSNVGLAWGKAPLRQIQPDHPICRGWTEYEIDDEFYLNPVIQDAKPLLQVRAPNGQDVVVGWVYERPGGGRSFATTLGHPYKNFQIEAFRRMILNGVLWTAKIEVPPSGARVAVSEETLKLPPQP
jgi:type 1 glutamine amidotransferase